MQTLPAERFAGLATPQTMKCIGYGAEMKLRSHVDNLVPIAHTSNGQPFFYGNLRNGNALLSRSDEATKNR